MITKKRANAQKLVIKYWLKSKLNHTAKKQLEVLINDKNIIGIEKYDDNQNLLRDKN